MLQLPAVLTHQIATACAAELGAAVRASTGAMVVADASALQSFDSSALAVLLAGRREAEAAGKTFAVSGLPERLRALAGLYGVASLIPVAPAAA
ncbi:MAG: STAS domain-containing protein [Polaromonas sp.]|nr:STAS domain-containing protein [Polaromonas sp.]